MATGNRRRLLAWSAVAALVLVAAGVAFWSALPSPREAGDEVPGPPAAPAKANAPGLQPGVPPRPEVAPAASRGADAAPAPVKDAQPASRVTGRVVDDPSGAVVAGALIRVWEQRGVRAVVHSATSDARGEFVLDGAPEDLAVTLVASAEGRAARSLELPLGRPRVGLVVRLEVGGVLEGEVRDADGNLAAGAVVRALGPEEPVPPRRIPHQWYVFDGEIARAQALQPTGTCDDRGHFEIRGVPLRKAVTALVQPPSTAALSRWDASLTRVEARSESATFTQPGERIRRDVRMPRAGSLRVRFARPTPPGARPTQIDLKGATLWFSAEDEDRQEDGSCLFAALSPGAYEVVVWLHDAPRETRQVEIRAGERTDLEIARPLGRTLEGVVVDERGRPLAHADVLWSGAKAIIGSTGEDGRFRLEGIPDASGQLDVHGPFHSSDWNVRPSRTLLGKTLLGVEPGPVPLRIVLQESPVVTGRLAGLAAGARVRTLVISKSNTGGGETTPAEDGRFELDTGAADTKAFLVFEQAGFAPLVVDVPALAPGIRHDLGELRFTKGRVVAGVVRGEDGQPLPGATVIVAEKWVDVQRATGADGSYQFEKMPDRETELRVNAEGYPVHIVRIPAGGTPEKADITLDHGGLLQIRVVDAGGEPVPHADVLFTTDGDYPYDRDYDKTSRGREAGADGKLEVRLQARGHRIRAGDPEWKTKAELESVHVRKGETTSVEIRLR